MRTTYAQWRVRCSSSSTRPTVSKAAAGEQLFCTLHLSRLDVYAEAATLVNEIATESLHFEWVDSEFVRAYTNGDYLLVEDVSACRCVSALEALRATLRMLSVRVSALRYSIVSTAVWRRAASW